MRLIEVRDGFVKFELEGNVSLSSFIEVSGNSKTYIAQVVQVKRCGNIAIVYAKLRFLYDSELKDYDGTLPDKNSQVSEFSFDIINKSLKHDIPILLGQFTTEAVNVILDDTYFNNSMLICADNYELKNTLLLNLQNQMGKSKNAFIIDTTGKIDADKYVAGTDFKLPLNKDALEFLYDDCLNDATGDSKSMIKSIFQELSEYAETVKFLPFAALKSIIDDMVDKAHVFKLIVLKNKLAKYDKLGYFASTQQEAEQLEKILSTNSIIDLSKLEPVFMNRYLASIYNILNLREKPSKIYVEVSNSINKSNLKEIVMNKKLESVMVASSKFRYLKDLQAMFSNFIIEPSFVSSEVFGLYKTILSSMPNDTLLVAGELTNNMPLVFIPGLYESCELSDEVVTVDEQNEECTEINVVEETEEVKDDADAEKQDEKSAILIDVNANEEEINSVIDAKSEALIEKVSQEVEPLNSGLMENIFDANTENLSEDNISNEGIVEEDTTAFKDEEDFHTKVNSEEISEDDSTVDNESAIQKSEANTIPSAEYENAENGEILEISDEDIELNMIAQDEVSEDDVHVLPEDELKTLSDEGIALETEISEQPNSINNDVEAVSAEISDFADADRISDELNIEQDDLGNNTSDASDGIENTEVAEDNFSDENSELQQLIDGSDEDTILSEDIDKEIIADVDSIYTTVKDESLSDSDLDFIDELNSNDTLVEEVNNEVEGSLSEDNSDILNGGFEVLDELTEEAEEMEILEEPIRELGGTDSSKNTGDGTLQTKGSTTPTVPVYGAEIPQEDKVMSDTFYQGDTVFHAKYGSGVVEKMIKYGTKTLYSINFDNVGRRLLDPNLTEIKKA